MRGAHRRAGARRHAGPRAARAGSFGVSAHQPSSRTRRRRERRRGVSAGRRPGCRASRRASPSRSSPRVPARTPCPRASMHSRRSHAAAAARWRSAPGAPALSGCEQQQRGGVAVACDRPGTGSRAPPPDGGRRPPRGERTGPSRPRRACCLRDLVEGGEEALLLAGELLVEGAARDAGELDQVPDGHAVVALGGHGPHHRPLDPHALVRATALRSSRCGPRGSRS